MPFPKWSTWDGGSGNVNADIDDDFDDEGNGSCVDVVDGNGGGL